MKGCQSEGKSRKSQKSPKSHGKNEHGEADESMVKARVLSRITLVKP